jgi:ammonia channel protein AmtB
MKMPTHFQLVLFFALVLAVILAGLIQGTAIDRIKYAARSFAAFVVVGIFIAWLMYPFSH